MPGEHLDDYVVEGVNVYLPEAEALSARIKALKQPEAPSVASSSV